MYINIYNLVYVFIITIILSSIYRNKHKYLPKNVEDCSKQPNLKDSLEQLNHSLKVGSIIEP